MAATFIETNELSGGVLPTGAGDIIRKEQYGIDAILSGYIIQNVSISKSRTTDDTYDQKNSLVSQLDCDQRWDMQMSIIGGSNEDCELENLEVGDISFQWNGKKWKLLSITYNGVYNDKKSYSITAFRTTNFPQQS